MRSQTIANTGVPLLFVAILAFPVVRAFFPAIPPWGMFLPLAGLVLIAGLELSARPISFIPRDMLIYLGLVFSFLVWLAVTSIWTISPDQYLDDLRYLGLLGLLTFCSASLLHVDNLDRFLLLLCLTGFVGGLLVVGEFILLGSLQVTDTSISSIYLTVANLIGVAATGASVRFLVLEKFHWGWGVLALALLLELSLSLARGALLATVLIVGAMAILMPALHMVRRQGVGTWIQGSFKLAAVFLLIAGTFTMGMQVERTRTRFLRLFTGEELESGGRGQIWDQALMSLNDNPFWGSGLGSNGILSRGYDEGYPHNLFLQVWLDGGWPALVLLAGIIGCPLLIAARMTREDRSLEKMKLLLPFLAMFIFQIFEYGKSGNFYAARPFFVFSIAVVIIGLNRARPETSDDAERVG